MNRTAAAPAAIAILIIVLAAGCSHRAPLPGRPEYVTPLPATYPAPPTTAAVVTSGPSAPQNGMDGGQSAPQSVSVWKQAAQPWLGTPYRIGGLSRDGIDCSGFTLTLHREVAQRTLARTSQEQWSRSVPVSPNQVRAGDLVFFNTTGKGVSHVGVFLADQEFVHASTSKGVIFSQLTDPYWSNRYLGARRPR